MESRQPDLWAAEFVTFPAATIFLLLRIFSRRITRIHFWWDDYFACLAYATAVAWAIVLPRWIEHGFGLHAEDVEGMSIVQANYTTKKYLFIIEHLYAFTLFFAKISILSFYWRMFRVANIQIAVSFLLVCSVLWILVRIFLTTFHCYPVQAFWDPDIKNYTCAIKSSDFFFGTVLAHVIIDVGILILPIVQIQKLQLPVMQKVAIILMFMFGILVCVAGLVIVSVSTTFDNRSTDMTWQLAPVIIWASVEVNLVTISTCLPTIRPACLYLLTCTNPVSSVGSSSNAFSRNYGRGQTKHSIRLATLPKEETSSTHELARAEPSGSESFSSEFETEADTRHGNIATVTGPSSPIESRDFTGVEGIMVRNETVVHVSKARISR
ncbi:hypothetical protein NW762_014372 [Fusarium torreyae]|uniref:Rhodopsin domain-containing protein n=1 Tax=Fusarium torreyae TaxID=1237075 RepID=A0A9W8RLV8_9HYPO|nr:hypothetical protein NW762_014372 [Fusarium torreyae]